MIDLTMCNAHHFYCFQRFKWSKLNATFSKHPQSYYNMIISKKSFKIEKISLYTFFYFDWQKSCFILKKMVCIDFEFN